MEKPVGVRGDEEFGQDERREILCEHGGAPQLSRNKRLLDRRLAASYVGVTPGRFEQLVREEVIPPPIIVDRGRRWEICALDRIRDGVRHLDHQAIADGPPGSTSPGGEAAASAAATPSILPDDAWFKQRAKLVMRVRRSMLSQHEVNVLREFKLLRRDEITMFGYYGTFEALMARGYVVEVSRCPPSSRPLVTYRLTDLGTQVIASIKGG